MTVPVPAWPSNPPMGDCTPAGSSQGLESSMVQGLELFQSFLASEIPYEVSTYSIEAQVHFSSAFCHWDIQIQHVTSGLYPCHPIHAHSPKAKQAYHLLYIPRNTDPTWKPAFHHSAEACLAEGAPKPPSSEHSRVAVPGSACACIPSPGCPSLPAWGGFSFPVGFCFL